MIRYLVIARKYGVVIFNEVREYSMLQFIEDHLSTPCRSNSLKADELLAIWNAQPESPITGIKWEYKLT
jgi:hypothetical protein